MELLLASVLLLTAAFCFFNGFHDTASTVANAVHGRALSPRWALISVTAFNFVGALMGQGIADRVGSGIVVMPGEARTVMLLLICALLGAVVWNILTYIVALPMSSTHALIGGLLGSGLVFGAAVHAEVMVTGVLIPLILSPILGFLLAGLATRLLARWLRDTDPTRLFPRAKMVQAVATTGLALAHGIQDAQKSAAVAMVALTAYTVGTEVLDSQPATSWPVRIGVAIVLAAGTYLGGWRITRTLGESITRIDPVQRVIADTSSNVLLFVAAFVFRAPISMTYTVGSTILGAAVGGRTRVRARAAAPMMACWVVSAPAAALFAAVFALALLRMTG